MIENLLHESTIKMLELINSSNEWKDELYEHAPPILWFGNLENKKPKIVTIGANPSRWEIINKNQTPRARFRVLKNGETLNDIPINQELTGEILNSYNSYFKNDPYEDWFGKINSPFRVECFLRGMNASYYDDIDNEFAAIHIDLFPFATKSDYNKISGMVSRDLFQNSWAKTTLFSLLAYISPKHVVVFGRANAKALFSDLLGSSQRLLSETYTTSTGKRRSYSRNSLECNNEEYLCTCLSTNLGNPKPFNKIELREYGIELSKTLTTN